MMFVSIDVCVIPQVFMKFNTPRAGSSGVAYESTLLGSILSLSCIPKREVGPYEFFNNPASQTKQEHDITESNLWLVCDWSLNLLWIKLCTAAHMTLSE